MKAINIEMGLRIKEKRNECKYTREALAEVVNISPQFLANIECGKTGMSSTTLKNLCMALGVSSDYIIFGKREGNSTDRIVEIMSNIDEKYLPFCENIMADALQIINASKN